MPRQSFTADQLLDQLRERSEPHRKAGMARYGISIDSALGVSMPNIRAIATGSRKDHSVADDLWRSGVHEARILAGLIDDPKWVTRQQCNHWALDFNSWDLVDQTCGNLFDKVPFAGELVHEWAERDEEYVKRAAFALIAWMAVHRKKDPDDAFLIYLPIIEKHAGDPRNFVKKAVNWSLRQIGKRSAELHSPSLSLSRRLAESDEKAKRWIGSDAVRELDSDKMKKRLGI